MEVWTFVIQNIDTILYIIVGIAVLIFGKGKIDQNKFNVIIGITKTIAEQMALIFEAIDINHQKVNKALKSPVLIPEVLDGVDELNKAKEKIAVQAIKEKFPNKVVNAIEKHHGTIELFIRHAMPFLKVLFKRGK